MAGEVRTGEAAAPQPAREMIGQAGVPWLEAPRHALAAARLASRLPHALLLYGPRGGGQSPLAWWAAQLVLCESRGAAPCGGCGSCILFTAGNHPDFRFVGLEEKASFIKVDQVRELCAALAMRSYRGGFKVGIIEPADRMNINSNNALLKSLEEPPEDTLLILPASRLDRLARTVVSRCQRIRVRQPPRGDALAWLDGQAPREDWQRILELAGGAPLRALELAADGAAELAEDMAAGMTRPGSTGFDPLRLADAWSRDRPAERLDWLEHWLAAWIRDAALSDAVNNNRDNALPSPSPRPNMKAAFELLDRVREARSLQEGSLNTLLLLEDLLVGFAEAFAVRPETRT